MSSFVYKFVTTQERAEQASDMVLEIGLFDTQATSVLEDMETGDWVCELYFPASPDLDELTRYLVEKGYGNEAETAELIELDDIDWVAHSLSGLPPVAVGRYFVHGRHDAHLVSPHQIPVLVEASQAFGTGHHATTEGCLSLMQDVKKTHRVKRILDVGCGSAVLAIAAVKDFNAPVIGTEIDVVSAKIAEINCRANNVAHKTKILCQDHLRQTTELAGGDFDLVIANILARPLMGLSQQITDRIAPNGLLILSGLLTHQQTMVLSSYKRFGFVLKKRCVNGQWLALLLERR